MEAKGNLKAAWTIYEQILDGAPELTKEIGFSLSGIARLAYKAKKYDIAAEYGQRLITLDATDREAATALGHVFLDSGDYPKALECFKVALNNATVLKAGEKVIDDLKVQIARVLYKSNGEGEQDSAISILTSVLGEKMEHTGLSFNYNPIMTLTLTLTLTLRFVTLLQVRSSNTAWHASIGPSPLTRSASSSVYLSATQKIRRSP